MRRSEAERQVAVSQITFNTYFALVTAILLVMPAPIGIIAGRGDRAAAVARTLALASVVLTFIAMVLAVLALGPLAGMRNFGAYGAMVGGLFLLAIGDVLALGACTTGLTCIALHREWPDLRWLGAALIVLLVAPAGFVYGYVHGYFGIVAIYYSYPPAAGIAIAAGLVGLGAVIVAAWGVRAAHRSARGGAANR